MLPVDRHADPERGSARAAILAVGALIAMLLIALAFPARALTQTAWETPRFLSPQAIGGTGFFYVRYSALPGDGQGGFLVWHPSALAQGVSVRLGAAEGVNGVVAGFGGVDVAAPIAAHTDARPLDLSWNAGAGLAVGEYLLVSVPVGIAAGRAWESGPVWFSPYVAVRAAMDLRLGDLAPRDEFEVSPGLDVGFDAAFDQGRAVILRFSTSLGDRSALAVGLVIGG
jgi:hypothetical protein